MQRIISDSELYSNTEISKLLNNNNLSIPHAGPVYARSTEVLLRTYFFIVEEAFPLSDKIMKVYPEQHAKGTKRVFNYRLFRARIFVESAFRVH